MGRTGGRRRVSIDRGSTLSGNNIVWSLFWVVSTTPHDYQIMCDTSKFAVNIEYFIYEEFLKQ